MNPRGPTASPIKDAVLVTGARRLAAATPRTDEAEHWMVVRKRRNPRRPLTTGARLNGASWHETTSSPTNTWQIAALYQPPDR